MICAAGTSGTDEPPGITASRLSQPPRTPPQCARSARGTGCPSPSSTTQGLFTWPEIRNSLVPTLLGGRSREPRRAAAQDGRRDRDRFDVVDRGRAAIEARRRPGTAASGAAGPSCLRGFRAARFPRRRYRRRRRDGRRRRNPSRCRRRSCRSAGVIGLVDRGLQRLALADELAANVDVGSVRAHREAGDQRSLRSACADRGA
jgi:hypothetical protein